MAAEPADRLTFKFHFLNERGQQTSMLRKRGAFDGDVLLLEETPIAVAAMLQTVVRENRMVLVYLTAEEGPGHASLLLPSKKVTDELKRRMDIARSSLWARQHRRLLEQQGRLEDYRDSRCPRCTATVVLSDLPESPQLYCHFCESLSTLGDEAPIPGESRLKLCDDCGMYSEPRKFTIFYFYFLIVFYGWWSKSIWRCPGCMRGEAWKMLFGNLLFLLGVPVAVMQLIRCYSGAVVGGRYRGLDGANLRARKGDVRGALSGYRSILRRVPHSAGIKYNLALTLLQQGDDSRAAETLALALQDCANYAPAYRLLKGVYTRLGETDRLRELEAMWEDVREVEQAEQAGLSPADVGTVSR